MAIASRRFTPVRLLNDGELSLGDKTYRGPIIAMVVLPFIVIPFLIVTIILAIMRGDIEFATLIGGLALLETGLFFPISFGVTGGLHRNFMHQSFVPNRPTKIVLAILALLSVEGKIVEWVTDHAVHHKTADTQFDLHSPHFSRNLVLGFLFAHMGWLIKHVRPDPKVYAPRLLQDQDIVLLDKLFPIFVILSLFWLYPIAGWTGVLLSVIRMFFVHHVTWSVNSLCHMFGKRPYKTLDLSTNFEFDEWWLKPIAWTLNFLSGGECYHCTHHAFPCSALHGTSGADDRTYRIIKFLERRGWVTQVRVPTVAQLTAKRRAA